MPKKNIARLTPVKRNVINKKTGSTNEITYYIDPNKDQHKERKRGEHDNTENEVRKDKKVDDTETPQLKTKPKENSALDNIKDFEDFGKQGIEPSAARQFFCNM